MHVRIAAIATAVVAAAAIYYGSSLTQPSGTSAGLSKPVAYSTEPTDSNAIESVRKTLIKLVNYGESSQHVLSGQSAGHIVGDLTKMHYRSWVRLTKFRDQPAPAIMSFDMGLSEYPKNTTIVCELSKQHVEAGGLVTVVMHPPNPWTGGEYDDMKHGTFAELMTPGNIANQRWLKSLDQAAAVLSDLQDQGTAVLWRPLHEANGDWFWWCAGGSDAAFTPEQYKQLWNFTYEYLQTKHELHNLIWVYCANVKTYPQILPLQELYPGDKTVDVVGLDYYGPDIRELNKEGCYDAAVATGKIVALCEFGSMPMDGTLKTKRWMTDMQKRFPRISYFVFWHSWKNALVALADLDDVEEINKGDYVHNLEDQ